MSKRDAALDSLPETDWVELGIKELECWEQRVLTILSESLSPETISYYFDEYKRDVRGLYERAEKGEGIFTRSIYGAISSISQIRSLLEEIKQPLPENIPIQIAARFAVLTFRAGYSTGWASPGRGMELMEPYAKTRLAQIQNQPGKRNRENIERDDILVCLDNYKQEKGKAPQTLNRFLNYLEECGYKIDEANKTVNPPVGSSVNWRKSRAFGTIENWRREFVENIRQD